MEELADALQVWQSAGGALAATVAFILSRETGRQLAEDVVLAFGGGATLGSGGALVVALAAGIHG